MPTKKNEPEFTITDRRKFTAEGEVRTDVPSEGEEERAAPRPAPAAKAAEEAKPAAPGGGAEMQTPPPPTREEQSVQEQAYRDSTKEMDSQLQRELGARRAQDFEITFERFLASLYMSAMVQLGLMHEQGGQPRVDLLGARQTVDTLALIQEKTKGNLTAAEENFLQNCLYELRMAYVEVTNALSRPPQPGGPATSGGIPPTPGKK
ncbi:MAG: DUF1844 domain-containing protein [Terriglobales bacterium]